MRKLFYLMIALCGLGFYSCDGKAGLGNSLAGEWTGGSEVLPGISAANAVTVDNYLFVPDSSVVNGDVTVTGMFTLTLADEGAYGQEPLVSTTVSGKSVARGTYSVVKDDEVLMNFKLDSIDVEFDPSVLALESNGATGMDSVVQGALTQTQLQVLKAQVLGTLQARYAAMRVLDDVKVKGNRMKFEVLDTDYYLTR